jgi:hypothetical protein
MMTVWILFIKILNTNIEYKYKFLYESNCKKVGRDITAGSKQMKYSCKMKKIKIEK